LGLATPLTLWLSLGRAAESGVIMRSTVALERLAKVEKIFFDKTGTLTKLPMEVQTIKPSPLTPLPKGEELRMREKSFLQIIASVENDSKHPLAIAIVEFAKANQIELLKPDSFKELPGMGVTAKLRITDHELQIVIGNERLIAQEQL
jgi:Cu+-exporting ATPase